MELRLAALPMPLEWEVPPASARLAGDGALTMVAPAGTDLFASPAGHQPELGAPRVLGEPPAGDWQLSARVTVGFAATYDAGVLLLWADERHWAKLCFERSPHGRPMAVSVVNRGSSDDAEAFTVDGAVLWLRISRLGPAWAFHASTDGSGWRLVRHFALGAPADAVVRVGFQAQSPKGDGCAVTFDQVTFTPDTLGELRDGS